MGKLTSSMAIFNSYVKLPEGIDICLWGFPKTWIFRFFSKTNPSTNRLGDSQGSWTFLPLASFCCKLLRGIMYHRRHFGNPEWSPFWGSGTWGAYDQHVYSTESVKAALQWSREKSACEPLLPHVGGLHHFHQNLGKINHSMLWFLLKRLLQWHYRPPLGIGVARMLWWGWPCHSHANLCSWNGAGTVSCVDVPRLYGQDQ